MRLRENLPRLVEELEVVVKAELEVDRQRHDTLDDHCDGCRANEGLVVTAEEVLPRVLVLAVLRHPPVAHRDDVRQAPQVTQLIQAVLPCDTKWEGVG